MALYSRPSAQDFNHWWLRIRKINVLLNLIDKIYLAIKDLLDSKYQLLINGRKTVGIKELKIPKASIDIDYLKAFDNVYENLEDYNPTKKRKVLIVLMIDGRYGS